MHAKRLMLLCVVAGAALSGGLYAARAQNQTVLEPTQVRHTAPYHVANTAPDATAYLPPPPIAGTARQQEDDTVFAQTRALQGSARWALAQADAVEHIPAMLKGFSCAAGFVLDADKAPHLVALLRKVRQSEKADVKLAKDHWQRPRPFVGTHEAVCTEGDRWRLSSSGAYPSGHTTWGWSTALVLSELLPERSTALLQRGRVYGESRIICGVHWVSDVQEGYLVGAAEIATMHGDADFRADMEAARAELATLKAHGIQPDAQTCAIEQDAARHSPLTPSP
ncbi:acid phosphatase [Acetobacter orientalis]|uniref:acid phosphatase n=1 Tax=Acetobacter orientalis TaxID=146474 RepID=UPI0039E77327